MKSRALWITGARGFIGRHVARESAARGDCVAGLGHGAWSDSAAQHWGVSHWLNGDITTSNLSRLANTTGFPDIVIHLAGGATVGGAIELPREDFFRTVATTIELLDWLRLNSPTTAVVAVSSAAVYGAGHEGPIHENVRLTPFSPYGHHKMMMESLCRSYSDSYGLPIVVARLFSVYGAELKKQLLWDLCTRLQRDPQRLVLGGSGEELRDWTSVHDVGRALLSVAAFAAPGVPTYNVGTGRPRSVRDVATKLIRAWTEACGCGSGTSLEFTGMARDGDPFSLIADSTRLNELGFAWLTSFELGIENYVCWFRSRKQIVE
jgi:UDP-glucose 4-epimerase